MKLGKCIIDIHHVGDNNVYFPKKKKGFGKTCIIDLWTKKDGVKDKVHRKKIEDTHRLLTI